MPVTSSSTLSKEGESSRNPNLSFVVFGMSLLTLLANLRTPPVFSHIDVNQSGNGQDTNLPLPPPDKLPFVAHSAPVDKEPGEFGQNISQRVAFWQKTVSDFFQRKDKDQQEIEIREGDGPFDKNPFSQAFLETNEGKDVLFVRENFRNLSEAEQNRAIASSLTFKKYPNPSLINLFLETDGIKLDETDIKASLGWSIYLTAIETNPEIVIPGQEGIDPQIIAAAKSISRNISVLNLCASRHLPELTLKDVVELVRSERVAPNQSIDNWLKETVATHFDIFYPNTAKAIEEKAVVSMPLEVSYLNSGFKLFTATLLPGTITFDSANKGQVGIVDVEHDATIQIDVEVLESFLSLNSQFPHWQTEMGQFSFEKLNPDDAPWTQKEEFQHLLYFLQANKFLRSTLGEQINHPDKMIFFHQVGDAPVGTNQDIKKKLVSFSLSPNNEPWVYAHELWHTLYTPGDVSAAYGEGIAVLLEHLYRGEDIKKPFMSAKTYDDLSKKLTENTPFYVEGDPSATWDHYNLAAETFRRLEKSNPGILRYVVDQSRRKGKPLSLAEIDQAFNRYTNGQFSRQKSQILFLK